LRIITDAMKGNRPPRSTSGRAGLKEIDLHLKPAQSAADVIERQISRFRGELEGAIRRGEKEIIFIHGVGSGKLKEEIRKILREEYSSCGFQDAPFSRYGYGGATLVTMRK
jgi:dsDNA-specific endonuclease/ATPase MutS2